MAQNNIFPYTDENILQSEEFKFKLSNGIGGDWRNLGNILNIKVNYLDTIDQNNNKTDEKAYSMLTKWVQINDNPTLMELKKGLFSIERVDLIGFVDEFIYSFSAAENACLKTPQRDSYKRSYKHSYSEDGIENSNSFQYNKNTEKIALIENSGGIKQIIKSLHLNKIREKFSNKTGLKKSTSVDNIVTCDIKTAKSMLTHKTGGSKKSSIYIRPFRKKVEDQEILKEQVRKKTNENQEQPLPDSIIKKSLVIDKNKILKRSKSFDVFEDLESKSAYQMFFDRSISNLESSEKELLYSYDIFSVPRNNLTSVEIFSKCCGEISYKIGSDWFRWGQHLGLSDSDLDNIKFNNINCNEKAHNVLKKWKEKSGSISWKQLKNELIAFKRLDIITDIEIIFADYLSGPQKIRNETMDFDLSKQTGQEYKSGENLFLF